MEVLKERQFIVLLWSSETRTTKITLAEMKSTTDILDSAYIFIV